MLSIIRKARDLRSDICSFLNSIPHSFCIQAGNQHAAHGRSKCFVSTTEYSRMRACEYFVKTRWISAHIKKLAV